MGVCIPISIKSQIARNTSKRDIVSSIFVVSDKEVFITYFRSFTNHKLVLIAAFRKAISYRTLFKHITWSSFGGNSCHGSVTTVRYRLFCRGYDTCALYKTNQYLAECKYGLERLRCSCTASFTTFFFLNCRAN